MILIDVPMPTVAIDCPCNEGEEFWCRVLYKHCQGKPLDECPLIDAEEYTQPERKTGEWIYGENDCQDGWYCSQCKGFVPWDYDYYGLDNIDFIKDFKTCPRCDARMISYTGMRKGE